MLGAWGIEDFGANLAVERGFGHENRVRRHVGMQRVTEHVVEKLLVPVKARGVGGSRELAPSQFLSRRADRRRTLPSLIRARR